MPFIYKISNSITNDCYIGSSVEIEERWRRHKRDLRKGKHHSIILQRAWNKYGEESFKIEILVQCERDEMKEKENEYLESLKPVYNICKIAYSTVGRKCTEVTKRKHRENARRNNVKPPENTWKQKQKPVIMMNENREDIKEFDSISEACRYIGRNHRFASSITRAIRRNIKAYNLYWRFK